MSWAPNSRPPAISCDGSCRKRRATAACATWKLGLDYDGKSVFIAALWSDDEASVAVRFQLSVPISAAEFDPQMFIRAAEGSERATSRLAA